MESLESLRPDRDEVLKMLQDNPNDAEAKTLLADIEADMSRAAGALQRIAIEACRKNFRVGCIYQLRWDDGTWYSATLESIKAPDPLRRDVALFVRLLGYNQEEAVAAERASELLRPWQPSDIPLEPGMKCYAVHSSGIYLEAVVERVSLGGTVWVLFTNEHIQDRRLEVPLTHVHLGKFYHQLKHAAARQPLTEEQLQQREAARRKKKRERFEIKKQDRMAQEANDWQAFIGTAGLDDAPPPAHRREAAPEGTK